MARTFVRICAVLIALRALTNLRKPFQGDDAVLVFFGQVLRGGDAALPAIVVGLFMLVIGIALWRPEKWAFPLIVAYAAYVPVNLLSWLLSHPEELAHVGTRVSTATDPSELRWYGALAMVFYAAVAIGTTAGPAWILKRQRSPS